MDITIHVRSPSLNDTLVIDTHTDSTIASLKESIESVHPQHPLPSNQRIIYSGKLLEDSDTLLNILKKVDKEVQPIFHLVVKPSVQSLKQASSKPAFASPILQQTQPQPEQAPQLQPQPEQPQTNQNETLPQLPGMLPGGYQVVYINGQYYLAPVLTSLQSLPQQQPFHIPQQQQGPLDPLIQPQIQPQQPQRPVIINQFGNIQAQRATSIWLALKLVVVLFMVCQGASIDRIFIFHTIAIVFFLYQTGRLRLVLRRVGAPQNLNQFGFNPQNNNNNNNNNNAPVPAGNEGNQEQQQQEDRESSGSQSTTAEPSSSVPARPTTTLDVWKRGAYAFAASLWPTYGVDPRIAQAFENNNNDQAEA